MKKIEINHNVLFIIFNIHLQYTLALHIYNKCESPY